MASKHKSLSSDTKLQALAKVLCKIFKEDVELKKWIVFFHHSVRDYNPYMAPTFENWDNFKYNYNEMKYHFPWISL